MVLHISQQRYEATWAKKIVFDLSAEWMNVRLGCVAAISQFGGLSFYLGAVHEWTFCDLV